MTKADSKDGIFWMKITSEKYWQIHMFKATVGGMTISQSTDDLILDSGSSLLYFP